MNQLFGSHIINVIESIYIYICIRTVQAYTHKVIACIISAYFISYADFEREKHALRNKNKRIEYIKKSVRRKKEKRVFRRRESNPGLLRERQKS